MKRAIPALLIAALLSLPAFAGIQPEAKPAANDQYVIVLKDKAASVNWNAMGGTVDLVKGNVIVIRIPAQALNGISHNPNIKYMLRMVPLEEAAAIHHQSSEPVEQPIVASATVSPMVASSPADWTSGTYIYDGAGNIAAIGSNTYGYDKLNRLTNATYPTASGTVSETYGYDGFGNMITRTGSPWAFGTMPIDSATNRIQANSSFGATYDGAGNLNHWSGVLEQDFDPLSMLREFAPSGEDDFYIYTAGGERIATKYNGQQEWNWSVRDSSGNVVRQYRAIGDDSSLFFLWSEDLIHRDGKLLAMQRVAEEGGRIHYHLDHLGTPRQLTSETREQLSRNDYDPFGTEASSIRQLAVRAYGANSMQYTGHERDYHSGVYAENVDYYDYMHARFYQPGWGRFLSVDPAQRSMRSSIPQSWNRYSYAINNPIRYTDPYGLDWFKIDDKWQYLKDVHEMYQFTYNKAGGVTGSQVIKGTQFGLVFNGTGLTQLRVDGTMRTIPAVSGRVSGWGEVHPGMQADRGRGPIPAGQYSFNPRDIQSIPAGDRVLGLVGRGGWPGGTYAWGSQRVFLNPAAGTNTYGRSGFSIHGGGSPGSAGCIDLCDMVNTFFSEIPRNVDQIPVDVDYNNPIPKP